MEQGNRNPETHVSEKTRSLRCSVIHMLMVTVLEESMMICKLNKLPVAGSRYLQHGILSSIFLCIGSFNTYVFAILNLNNFDYMQAQFETVGQYSMTTTTGSYNSTKLDCQSRGLQLASFYTQSEVDDLKLFLSANDATNIGIAWVGFDDMDWDGVYNFLNGDPVPFPWYQTPWTAIFFRMLYSKTSCNFQIMKQKI